MARKQVCLIIRDGWGLNENPRGNAVHAADTSNCDRYKREYPWTVLEAAGEPVGLPDGYQGSSEVGHLNMGAGRIVVQELKRIDDGLSSGELFKLPKWREFVTAWRETGGTLHLLGLLQDEGVHAHQEHLFKIMRQARADNPAGAIVVHPFLDGRDTPPRSCEEYISKLQQVMDEVGNAAIGTVMGRYYGMDRSRDWNLTDKAYNCLVRCAGRRAETALQAVHESYTRDKTPDGFEMVDEYIPPYCIGDFDGIEEGDCVFHTNYRQDRAIQLTQAFVEPDYEGDLPDRPRVAYLGFTRYYDEFQDYLMGPMGGGGSMDHLLGEVIGAAGLKQLRIAETQKFRHVTSFFNGKSTTPFPGEDQVDVPSRFDPASFASHPEMEAYTVTDRLMELLATEPEKYDFIAVNYANCDMVGHTGEFEAARKAGEIVDECVGRLADKLVELGFAVLITADHGNSDQMIDYETGKVKTSHTLNPVECIYVGKDAPGTKLIAHGKLADLAPTILYLLGLPVPRAMTAENIICDQAACCRSKTCPTMKKAAKKIAKKASKKTAKKAAKKAGKATKKATKKAKRKTARKAAKKKIKKIAKKMVKKMVKKTAKKTGAKKSKK